MASPHNVFISFRGIDTRYTFTDHLYRALQRTGIPTFMDHPELRRGDVISDGLIQAIRDSKTYVVVFSENYASSTWCLDELVEIYNCCQTMNRLVIPVYYNIDPSVVRHQTKSFKSAFKKHENRAKIGFFQRASDEDTAKLAKIKKWRRTLSEVAGFSGQPITAQRSEADIVDEIVDKILLQINPKTLHVAKYPVGLDSHVENVTALMMSSDTEVVTKIGIYGMGGVGKSTLAKAVYNQNYHRFQGSCFLENVREASVTTRGLVSLQQKLIDNVLKCKNINIDNVNHGIELIKARISSIKVLIVFDDLDDPKSVEFLEGIYASGSIILITTRNEDLLDSINVEARYKVNELGDAESRQLFAKHALRDNITPDTFAELSEKILEHAAGLPLALEVFGSNLLKETMEGRRLFSDKLKRISLDDVESKLMISFDALKCVDPMLQDIFLDFACFFIGWNIKEVVEIMGTCYTFLSHNIDILKKRCLLTINDRDELGMHDLLRDMGRNIARNSSPDEPGKHSRLWVSEDICNVLKKHLGTEAIKGIVSSNCNHQDALEGVSFNRETFKRMSKLRFLKLNKVKLIGSFEQTFGNLRWLCWDRCPLECLPLEFYPQKLVILELPRSKMRTMWELNKVFEKLKTLNMKHSLDLTTTPDFNQFPHLEALNLELCESLVEVHISIGSLERLVVLNLHGCVNLRSLPDIICNLRALKSLNISGCSSLKELPIELGNLESLKELNAEHLTVMKLPDSIGRLSKLVELRLSYNKNLRTLPDSICNLRALNILNIGGCSSLDELPKELGKIESLTELNAWGLTVSKLPDSIRCLSKLVELNLNDNELPEIPSSSSTASGSAPTNWDVYLSFRGTDTRFGFIGHLYSALNNHGVRTFMDDLELHSGEVISRTLSRAIQESKTYIVVLSENYASSSWCLDELAEILDCCETNGRLIIPVFYNMGPSIVRWQKGSFNEAFERHETHFAMEKVNKWRLTLREVANFSGYHIEEHRSEADTINEIVDEIIFEINPKALSVATYPVRLGSRVKGITTLFRSGKEGVIKFGIYGMGGVGKTTLAKALYNQLLSENFEGSCFLTNVREASQTFKGLESLQQKLINDVLKMKKRVKVESVEEGSKFIKERICSSKVLVVIDDLEELNQYESLVGPFASGSVVIITTRNEHILDIINVDPRYRYRVNELDEAESLALFTQHAFGNAKPNSTYMVLSKDILRLAAGLPLALEVFGSYLYKRSEGEWRSYIKKLQQIPYSSIQQRLVISFGALESDDPMLTKMFLDIACFFIGSRKEEVVKIMETYYSKVDHKIDILKKRCLLKINDRDELEMHVLLQDMGREIACNSSYNEPGKHSRLWVPNNICDVLKEHKGTEAIEGIIPHNHLELEGKSFSAESFKRMSKLRFLYLNNVNLTGSFEQIFEDLRWLCWERCPLRYLPSKFYPRKLVILELPHSKMKKMWQLNKVSHVFERLKTLNMSYSKDLTTTPDFTKMPCLETLSLNCCESLEEVHISIGSLVRLVSLDLHGCASLRSLPHTICNLKVLEVLIIGQCSSLEKLPIQLGNIISLTELNACRLTVPKLPDSIGHLYKLVELRLSYNWNLRTLPDTICNLISLEILDLGHCGGLLSIAQLPPNLKYIRADGCTSLEGLPDLSNLKQLEELDLTDCSKLTEILGLEELTSIKALDLAGCNSSLLAYLTKLLFQVPVQTGDIREFHLLYNAEKKSDKSDLFLSSP